jgi:hypothetical protein
LADAVPVSVAVTIAPDMEAPLASFTVPEMLAVTLANIRPPASRVDTSVRTTIQYRLF